MTRCTECVDKMIYSCVDMHVCVHVCPYFFCVMRHILKLPYNQADETVDSPRAPASKGCSYCVPCVCFHKASMDVEDDVHAHADAHATVDTDADANANAHASTMPAR